MTEEEARLLAFLTEKPLGGYCIQSPKGLMVPQTAALTAPEAWRKMEVEDIGLAERQGWRCVPCALRRRMS